MNFSARRLNRLGEALEARLYLEIGVKGGDTFRDVGVKKRIGVDPAFAFDVDMLRNDDTLFFPEESDTFFRCSHNGEAFDLVFIDGLHKFEQVVRDLSNALVYSHPKTVFILDDTKPSDVYSAIPDMEEAVRHRRQAGGTGGDWHGDVYKTVAYIHDFYPSLNYRTMTGSGNPQTVVWRSNRFQRQPRFDSLERISRLTYFDLMNDSGFLNESPEEEALALCLREVGRA